MKEKLARLVLNSQRALVRAEEALRVDDDVELCEIILRDLRDELGRSLDPRRFRCPDCPATYEWGEELVEHRERMHGEELPL